MKIEQGVALARFTTFSSGGPARGFMRARSVEDVAGALAERRKVDLNDIEAVKEVLAEFASSDQVVEVGGQGFDGREIEFVGFEDADDLAGEAVARQQARVLPVLPVEATPDDPLADRVAALVGQRLRLFTTLGKAAHVSRLRAPFQPRLAEGLAQGRRFLRGQVRTLFAPELAALGDDRAAAALAAADVLTSYETYQLLTDDRGFGADEVRSVLTVSLTALLTTGGSP